MTINPCKHHPGAKGDDAPMMSLNSGGYFCPLCFWEEVERKKQPQKDKWNAANPLPEVKNG